MKKAKGKLMGRRHAKQGADGPALPRGFLARLEQRMAEKGISRYTLSLKAGLGETYLSDLCEGKNKKPSIPAMSSIAKVLETTVAYLLGETYDDHRLFNSIPLVGIVESGTLRKLPQGVPTLVMRPKSKHYPLAKHFSLYVNDTSMAAAHEQPLLPGMEALCIDIEDAELEVESGKIYAIRRTRDGGENYETILRRARVFRDRVELLTESGKPGEDETIIHKGRLLSDPRQPIFAFGLMYGAFQSFE